MKARQTPASGQENRAGQGTSEYRLLTGLFFRLLPYQVMLLLINAVNGIVDSLHASNFIGKAAMSALGLYSPLDHFLYALSIMLVSGSQLLCGRYLGKNQQENVQRIFTLDLILAAGLSLLTSLLLVTGALSDLTRLFVQDQAERTALNQYVLGVAPGIPALVVGQQLFAFLSLENRTRRTTAATIACMLTNAAADVLFIVVLRMGTFGLGLASALSLWVFMGIQAHYYLSGKSSIRFSLRAARLRDTGEIISQGYSGAISRFVEMFRCIIVNALVLRFIGSIGVSSFAAVNSVMAVFWPLVFGMVAVNRILLGISMGEEDRRSVVDIMHISITRGMLIVSALALLLCGLGEPITRLFYRDPADPIYRMTIEAFRILPFCMPLAVVSLQFACYAQAAGLKRLQVLLPVLDGAVFVSLFAAILIPVPALGMNGLYIANVLNGVGCALTIILVAWISLRRAPRSLEDLLLIPDSFGAPEDARIDLSVTEMDEVLNVSRQVTAFCRRRGIDQRRASLAGLALEEMAGNVVEHGFTVDRKRHSIDIRIVHKDDDVILRLRDNCIAFDPSESARLMDPPDGMKNVGLRIVYSMAKEVRYQHLLGLNVLTMRI